MDSRSIQTEIDAAYLYGVLADTEADPVIAQVFRQMSEIEAGHAAAFAEKNMLLKEQLPGPSGRARTLRTIGKIFGNAYILGVLLDTEKGLSGSLLALRRKSNRPASLSDTAHVTILRNILSQPGKTPAASLSRFEQQHRNIGGNALRAAVLGGNDGLVSNFSLVMGVAGAAHGGGNVLLAGVAGLLAGALSMALGEWISVKSSQELSENQMQLEMDELENSPQTEEKELALIYITKGIPEAQARQMAADLMKDKTAAHEVLIREELGISPEDLKGSAMEAAVSSFILFAIGAIIPVIPFFFLTGYNAIIGSAVLSALGLFGIGAAITLFTGKRVWSSGIRQVVFGLAAAGITFFIGNLVGASLG